MAHDPTYQQKKFVKHATNLCFARVGLFREGTGLSSVNQNCRCQTYLRSVHRIATHLFMKQYSTIGKSFILRRYDQLRNNYLSVRRYCREGVAC
jgi:hypothetical protein